MLQGPISVQVLAIAISGFLQVLVVEAGGLEHGAGAGAADASDERAAVVVQRAAIESGRVDHGLASFVSGTDTGPPL